MEGVNVAGDIGIAASATIVLGFIYEAVKLLLRHAKTGSIGTLNNVIRDWKGEPARPGHDREPGVPERLRTLEKNVDSILHEFKPNSGSSTKDQLNRVENVLAAIEERLDRIEGN